MSAATCYVTRPPPAGKQRKENMNRLSGLMNLLLLAAIATAVAFGIGLTTAGAAAADTVSITTTPIGASQDSSASPGVPSVAPPEAHMNSGRVDVALALPMQETQMSFNLQYLQLQSQMQNDNRQYTAVSNILKTKHDTVKNSIDNVR